MLKDPRLIKNQALWDSKVELHTKSEFYRLQEFEKGWNSLNSIELELLGDVKNKKVLHLQCHFGQDTLSLQRLGAKCIGVDFSNNAISTARKLNARLGLDAQFINKDVMELGDLNDGPFDVIFSSYGTIGWLPKLDTWAQSISSNLKPEGKFIFVEFHPFIWTFDNDFNRITYPYFNRMDIIENESITYADGSNSNAETITWNHSLSEVFQALKNTGISVIDFKEYDYSPYNCMPNLMDKGNGEYRFKHIDQAIPMVYSIVGEKSKK